MVLSKLLKFAILSGGSVYITHQLGYLNIPQQLEAIKKSETVEADNKNLEIKTECAFFNKDDKEKKDCDCPPMDWGEEFTAAWNKSVSVFQSIPSQWNRFTQAFLDGYRRYFGGDK